MLPKVISLITKIVNISLDEGCLCRDWMVTVLRLLLKKSGLQLIFPNLRPVSNLTFISKVIEQCMLLQVSQYCDTFGLQPDYQLAYREYYEAWKVSQSLHWLHYISQLHLIQLTMTSFCLYLTISMK